MSVVGPLAAVPTGQPHTLGRPGGVASGSVFNLREGMRMTTGRIRLTARRSLIAFQRDPALLTRKRISPTAKRLYSLTAVERANGSKVTLMTASLLQSLHSNHSHSKSGARGRMA
jgi:hypothetical protein